jgi:AcrR family transcriptional regulator
MTKKSKLDEHKLISKYIEIVLDHGKKPTSIYKFCKELQIEEGAFYSYFSNFEKLEKRIFSLFFENSLELLAKNDDFKDFDARNKVLSLYFTLFEMFTANRSYVIFALNQNSSSLKNMGTLSDLRTHFKNFVKTLDIEMIDFKQERIEKIQEKGREEFFWIQLLITLKFWMEDSSPSFEKTDVLIEKSVQASFDAMNTQPIKSFIDLGKFIVKERMNFKL